ncbi:FAD-binding oxidoreductase [Chryseolinea lacunae]|uniref:Siderophore-interacting protein n=1 Tax=Chryseolinea lacunae TaxID=2801331 RepID=A0ABS1KMY3_9BACT|nr:FAD-binding oxidoreductase [Chryseolinea lacunae]MBL0740693.1 siderophore-interacting protein [Chryseolinea lacunae]
MISTIPKWIGNLFEASLRPNFRVLATTYLSPQIKKIRFRGDLSKMNLQIGYANVIRVGETEYRNYTVAGHNAKDGTLDMIFHIHGHGVGSNFINSLNVGDELFISDPRGKKFYEPAVKQQVIFGDETSLGLACSFLRVLKENQHQFQFYFALGRENEQVLPLLGFENYTVLPKGPSSIPHYPDMPTANFILTGNAKSVHVFRKGLKNLTTGKIFSQGYWLEGKKGL